jgi:hypothetical protein
MLRVITGGEVATFVAAASLPPTPFTKNRQQ